ncbi:hypothetical protein [Nocardia blacklockiae]|uniref:hypothetical protein n=1 Tax=Nocardia blacklockiae TaxID=480036 RepID=UPI0018944F13|nr:hypothetical protein [Nocardia blacklockiae]MBF6176213.1 hypothetical protein [Nocardia blacklockiae]
MAGTTPRVLRMTFEFRVPEGNGKNIQDKALGRAVDKIENPVRSIAPEAFPWANEMVVRREYNYAWWSGSEYENKTYDLPANEYNAKK